VTNLAMPGLSGIDLARTIRSDLALRSLPIVAISASASTFTREKAMAAGCDDFIAKPLRAEEILTCVGRLLGVTWHMTEVRRPAPPNGRPTIDGIVVEESRLKELYDLAMKGDVQELLARTANASAGDPVAAPLYEEVQRLARRFDVKGIRRILDAARDRML
jgi:CheY-like chemotaxis protein